MAKAKKTEEDLEDKPNEHAELQKLLDKKYGKVSFDGSYIRDNPRQRVPTTPAMDLEICGGIPEGTITQISGKPKTGKTSLALQIAANGQLQGRYVYYLDVEHRFDEKNLSTIRHLQTTPDKFKLIQSSKGNILTAQKFLNMAEDIINGHERAIIILDSISALCSEGEMAKEIGEASRSDGPKMFGQFCRKNTSSIPLNKVIVLAMTHLIANTSGYGPANGEDGGNKIQFQDAGLFRVKTTWNWEKGSGDAKKKIGHAVDWQIVYNPGGAPGGVVKTYLRYGYGYDDIWEITSIAIDLGLINKSGAWFLLPDKDVDGNEIKVQGQEKVHDYYTANPDKCAKLHQDIKDMIT